MFSLVNSAVTVADYPLGRIGSCLMPGMVPGPGPFIVNFLYLIYLVSDFVTWLKVFFVFIV